MAFIYNFFSVRLVSNILILTHCVCYNTVLLHCLVCKTSFLSPSTPELNTSLFTHQFLFSPRFHYSCYVVFISVWPIRDCSLKLFMYLCVYISHFVFTKGFNALWETKTRWDDDFRPWLIKLVKHPHECGFNTIVLYKCLPFTINTTPVFTGCFIKMFFFF